MLNKDFEKKCEHYLDLLMYWNKKFRLTGFNRQEAWRWGIESSIAMLPYLPEGTHLDVGSGAGFPAIPLAIAGGRPMVLCEASFKKCCFLREVRRALDLDIEVIHARVETLAPLLPRSITARALAAPSQLVRWLDNQRNPEARLYSVRDDRFASVLEKEPCLEIVDRIHLGQGPHGPSYLWILSFLPV